MYRKPVLVDRLTREEYHIEDGTTIGRDPDNDIVIPDSCISASRHHAGITKRSDGVFVLRDLESTYGTYVFCGKNPEDWDYGKDERTVLTELNNGAKIVLGVGGNRPAQFTFREKSLGSVVIDLFRRRKI